MSNNKNVFPKEKLTTKEGVLLIGDALFKMEGHFRKLLEQLDNNPTVAHLSSQQANRRVSLEKTLTAITDAANEIQKVSEQLQSDKPTNNSPKL